MQKDTLIAKAAIYQSLRMAQSFLATAELVGKDGFSSGNHLFSFHLLMSNALELLPKIYIGANEINKNEVELSSRMRGRLIELMKKSKHNLAVLYGSCPELKGAAGIRDVRLCINEGGFTAVYKFNLDNDKTIFVIDSESARFGMFSEEKTNALFLAIGSTDILEVGKKLENYVGISVQKLFPTDAPAKT